MSNVTADNEENSTLLPTLLSQLNWQAANRGEESREIVEHPLYSDAHITGDRPQGSVRMPF